MSHKEETSIDETSLDVDQAILVCKVREDGELALRLQAEEDERHYARNVEIRKLAIVDLKKAKELQEEEDRLHQEWISKKEEEDRKRAAYLQQKIYRRDLEDRHRRENLSKRDEREARKLAAEDEKRTKLENLQVINDRKMAEQMLAKMKVAATDPHNEQSSRPSSSQNQHVKKFRTEQERIDFEKAALLQDEELARHIHEEELREANLHRLPPHHHNNHARPGSKFQKASSKKQKNSAAHRTNGNFPPSKQLSSISTQHEKIKRLQSADGTSPPPRPPPPSNHPNQHPSSSSSSTRNHHRNNNHQHQQQPSTRSSQPSTQSQRHKGPHHHHNNNSRSNNLYGDRLDDNGKDVPIDEDAYEESYARFVSRNSAERCDNRQLNNKRKKSKSDCKQQ